MGHILGNSFTNRLGGKRREKAVRRSVSTLPGTLRAPQCSGLGLVTCRTRGSCGFKSQPHTCTHTHTHTHAVKCCALLCCQPGVRHEASMKCQARGGRHPALLPPPESPCFGCQEPPVLPQTPDFASQGIWQPCEEAEQDQDPAAGGCWGSRGGRMAAFCKLQGCLLATDNTFGST